MSDRLSAQQVKLTGAEPSRVRVLSGWSAGRLMGMEPDRPQQLTCHRYLNLQVMLWVPN
jgi:hypothetical protein